MCMYCMCVCLCVLCLSGAHGRFVPREEGVVFREARTQTLEPDVLDDGGEALGARNPSKGGAQPRGAVSVGDEWLPLRVPTG